MKYPSPYFSDVPVYGNLDFDVCLFYYDTAVLFTLKNQAGSRFICVCCETRNEQRWIINPITDEALKKLVYDKITLADIFTIGEQKKVVAVRNYSTLSETFKLFEASELDALDLPTPGFYLDIDDEYKKELIEELMEHINE